MKIAVRLVVLVLTMTLRTAWLNNPETPVPSDTSVANVHIEQIQAAAIEFALDCSENTSLLQYCHSLEASITHDPAISASLLNRPFRPRSILQRDNGEVEAMDMDEKWWACVGMWRYIPTRCLVWTANLLRYPFCFLKSPFRLSEYSVSNDGCVPWLLWMRGSLMTASIKTCPWWFNFSLFLMLVRFHLTVHKWIGRVM